MNARRRRMSRVRRAGAGAREGTARPIRVALIGLFGVPNYGNQASLDAAVETLRRRCPDVDLACVCYGTREVKAQHGIHTESLLNPGRVEALLPSSRVLRIALFPLLETGRWIGSYRVARRVDRFVVPGTGLLDDFGVSPLQMPLVLFRWAVTARCAGASIALVSIGAGPITHPVSRWLMTRFAKAADSRTYRDRVSADFMAALGAPGRVTPDVVFSRVTDARPNEDPSRRPVIGVGVMAYWGWKNDPSAGDEVFRQYIGKIVDIVRRLRERDLDVLLVIGESTDLVAVEAAIERLEPHERTGVSVAPIENYDDVIRCTAETDATIVTRYHGLVAALLTNRPTVSIGYAEKNAEMMNAVGLGAYCHGIDGFDVDAVLDDLELVRTEWAERGPEVAKVVSEWARQIDDLFVDAVRCDQR